MDERVTAHAIDRWLERVDGVPIGKLSRVRRSERERITRALLTDGVRAACIATASFDGAIRVNIGPAIATVADGKVVTVTSRRKDRCIRYPERPGRCRQRWTRDDFMDEETAT